MMIGHRALVCRTDDHIFRCQMVSHGLTAGLTIWLSYCRELLVSSAQMSLPPHPRRNIRFNSKMYCAGSGCRLDTGDTKVNNPVAAPAVRETRESVGEGPQRGTPREAEGKEVP